MIFRLKVDDQTVRLPVGDEIVLFVEYHDDEAKDRGLPLGAQLQFKFTRQGEIRDYVDDERVKEISAATYDELMEMARKSGE